MGSRHTVQVIVNGKTVLNQYGQWDGYVSYGGEYIVNSIKEIGKERLKEIFSGVRVSSEDPSEFHSRESMLGFKRDTFKIEEFIGKNIRDENGDRISYRQLTDLLVKRFGSDIASRYLLITRDTGYRVLDVIDQLLKDGAKDIETYLSEGECYWHYEINLDDDTFTIKIGNVAKTWPLDSLPSDEYLDTYEERLKEAAYQRGCVTVGFTSFPRFGKAKL